MPSRFQVFRRNVLHFGMAACLLAAGCAAPKATASQPPDAAPAAAEESGSMPAPAADTQPPSAAARLWAEWEAAPEEAVSGDGLFALSLAGNAQVHPAGKPLHLYAALTYLGDEAEVSINHSMPLVQFLIRGNGYACGEPWWQYVMQKTAMQPETPLQVPLRLYSIAAPGSRDEAFFAGAYQNHELRLPPGTYDIIAAASFALEGHAVPDYSICAAAQIRVEAQAE